MTGEIDATFFLKQRQHAFLGMGLSLGRSQLLLPLQCLEGREADGVDGVGTVVFTIEQMEK